MTAIRGPGLGEPYCSQECLERGGQAIFQAMSQQWTGICGVCQAPVTVTFDSDSSIVPFNQQTLYFCGADSCVAQVRELVGSAQVCGVCGSPAAEV